MAERIEVLDIDLSNLQNSAEETGKTLKDLKDEIKGMKKSLDGAVIGSDDYAKKLDALTNAQNELKKVTKSSNKEIKSTAGSYNALSKEMSELKKEWKATGDAAKRAQLGEKIDNLNDQLKELDKTIGNNQRNVGNYQSALEGINEVNFDNAIESSEGLAENMGHVARIGAGISGIFEVAAGTMNMFGMESEKLEKIQAQMTNLIAITQGLSAIGDSVESFTKLTKAVRNSAFATKLFTRAKKSEDTELMANTAMHKTNEVAVKSGTVALKSFKVALISTGIGAVIVALSAGIEKIIEKWDDLSNRLNNPINAKVKVEYDAEKITKTANDLYEVDPNIKKRRDTRLSVMKAEGKSEEALLKQRKEWNEADKKDLAEKDKNLNYYKRYGKELENRLSIIKNNFTDFNKLKEFYKTLNVQSQEATKIYSDLVEGKVFNVALGVEDAFLKKIEEFDPLGKQYSKILKTYLNPSSSPTREMTLLAKKLAEGTEILMNHNQETIKTYEDARKQIASDVETESYQIESESKILGITTFKNNLAERIKLTEEFDKDIKQAIKDNEDYINQIGDSLDEQGRKADDFLNKFADQKTQDLYKINIDEEDALKQLDDLYSQGLILDIDYEETKLKIADKYAKERQDVELKYLDEVINAETARYRTANNIIYSNYIGDIEKSEGEGNLVKAGGLKKEYYKENLSLLEEHKNKIIELGASEEQLSEVEAMIAENRSSQHLADIEIMQGKLDTMNTIFDTMTSASDSILSIGDGLSSSWTNVFTAMQNGVNMLGESLKASEEDWQTYSKAVSSVMAVTSSVLQSLADEQSKINYETDADRRKGFEKQKKFQIAAVTMNTLAGVLNATTSIMDPVNAWMGAIGQPAAAIAVGTSVATLGALQISKIKQTPYEGSGNSEISNPAPTAIDRVTTDPQLKSLVENTNQNQKVKDSKVYVTETDISKVQNNVRTTVEEATF